MIKLQNYGASFCPPVPSDQVHATHTYCYLYIFLPNIFEQCRYCLRLRCDETRAHAEIDALMLKADEIVTKLNALRLNCWNVHYLY